jgi:small-conductance mechanosensitive channel
MPDTLPGRFRLVLAALAVLIVFSAVSNPAVAQIIPGSVAQEAEPVAQPAPPSPNDIREFMRLLSDPGMIGWLKTQTELSGIAGDAGIEPAENFQLEVAQRVETIRLRLTDLVVSWRNLPAAPAFLAGAWQEQMSADQTLRTIIYVIIFLVVGSGLEWLYRQYTQKIFLGLELRSTPSLGHRLRAAALRAVLIFAGLMIFSIGTIGTFLSFSWPPFVENMVLNLLTIVITIRAVSTVSLFLLAPRVPELRLVPLSNNMARPLHRWVIAASSVAILALTITDIFAHLAGTTDALGATLAVAVAAGGACAIIIILAVWHLAWIGWNQSENLQNSHSKREKFWPGYLSILTLVTWFLWLLSATEVMWTVVILGLLFPVTRLLNGCINYFFDQAGGKIEIQEDEAAALLLNDAGDVSVETTDLMPAADAVIPQSAETDIAAAPGEIPEPVTEDEDEDDEPVSALELYRPVARRFVRFVAVLCAIFALLGAWGGNIFSLSESQTFSGRLVGILADIITAVLIADLIWIWAKSAIDRRLANYVPPQGSEAPGPEARMATLLPILRMTLMVTLIAVVIMTIMASIGINVGPLLAGAGVIGIAVGFGAQALVKDIVSGIFFLIDDAFRIGEYIEVGDLRGTVESMSIRSLRVRHHLGAIHTIPFGELSSLTNYSRDWVIMRLEFRVPFETDIKLVKKIVKKIGAELQENETYGDGILQTLKSQGVRRMEEFNMVVGVKFMAKPGSQWLIRRDAYQKLRDAFEANGISFAQRNVKVEVLGDQVLGEEAKNAIAGAAQNAIEAAAGPPQAAPDEP